MIIRIKREKQSFLQQIYLTEIIKGLLITGRHLLKNILHKKSFQTTNWPEQKSIIPDTYRAEHRLMLRNNGSIRCTACMLCATACPANCIKIEASEGNHPKAEKYAKEFIIDHLRCVYCGLCVDACPCDAIRMDTNMLVSVYDNRADFIKNIEYLKNNHGNKTPYSVAEYP